MEIIELEKSNLIQRIVKALELINQARDDPEQVRLIAFNQSITAGCSIHKNLLKEKEKNVNKGTWKISSPKNEYVYELIVLK